MSNSTLPEAEQTAYERWEFPVFKPTNNKMPAQASSFVRQKEEPAPPPIELPTLAQLEEIQRQAHDEAYQAAYAEGAKRMTTLLSGIEQALQQTDQKISQDILNLALEVARQMVQQTLKANPEILLNTIREAINSLPHFNQGAHLVLHPDDATIVRAGMGEQLSHSGWKIFEDAKISPGGARIETSHSQIDATLENRWQRIVSSIGQDSSWIQE